MVWFSSLGSTEIIFIILFLVLYLLYILRVLRTAKQLHTSYGKLFTKLILRTLYFTLFIVALLGPSFGEASREIRSVGKDIMIAVDLSESMNAHDIAPTRLEKVKFELNCECPVDAINILKFSPEVTWEHSHIHQDIRNVIYMTIYPPFHQERNANSDPEYRV